MNDYGPSITLCRLRERESDKGTRYWSGYISGARITILPNNDRSSDEDATHVAMCSQGDRSGLADGQYNRSFLLAKMWMKTSAKGTEWLAGRLGLAKVAVLPIRDRDGDDTHELKLTQAPPKTEQPRASSDSGESGARAHDQPAMALKQPRAPARRSRSRYTGEPAPAIVDDPMPF
jgi:hypothetical protein